MSAPEEPPGSATQGVTAPVPESSAEAAPPKPVEPSVRIPSLSRRVVLAVLRAIPLVLLLLVLPFVGLSQLAAHGITTPIPFRTIGLVGAALILVSSARYVARPTKAYGPLTVAGSAVAFLYLWTLVSVASVTLSLQKDVTLTLFYGGFLLLALFVPVFGMASGVVTTVEDLARPGERVRYEYAYPR